MRVREKREVICFKSNTAEKFYSFIAYAMEKKESKKYNGGRELSEFSNSNGIARRFTQFSSLLLPLHVYSFLSWKCQITLENWWLQLIHCVTQNHNSLNSKFVKTDKLRCNLSAWDLFAHTRFGTLFNTEKSGKVKKYSICLVCCATYRAPPTVFHTLDSLPFFGMVIEKCFLLKLIQNHGSTCHDYVCSRALLSGIIPARL